MKIKINQNTYTILWVSNKDKRLEIEDGDYRSGITDFKKKEIYIANNLNEDSHRYTLIHELTHAIMDSYGFLQVEWNDEIVADFMAIYIYEIAKITRKIEIQARRMK